MKSLLWLGPPLFTGLVLLGFDRLPLSRNLRWAFLTMVIVGCLGLTAQGAQLIGGNVRHPPEWDFQAFWIPAKAAAEGRNFYDPAQLHAVVDSAETHGGDFVREILDVGFWYPAPTMLFLEPLGRLSMTVASAVWAVLNVIALLVAVAVLRQIFVPTPGWRGLLLTAALLLSLRGTLATFAALQTDFILLLLVALFWRNDQRWRGGVYLALGAIVKPLCALFALAPLLRGRWKVLAGGAIAGLVAVGATVWRFGWKIPMDYVTVSSRLPPWVYTEPINQSLLATLLRLKGEGAVPGASPMGDSRYLVCVSVVTLVSGWLIYRLGESDTQLGLVLLVPSALLIYPATLAHYSVLLILPVLYLWTQRREAFRSSTTIIVLLVLVYFLTWVDGGHVTVLANLAMWLALVALAYKRLQVPRTVHA